MVLVGEKEEKEGGRTRGGVRKDKTTAGPAIPGSVAPRLGPSATFTRPPSSPSRTGTLQKYIHSSPKITYRHGSSLLANSSLAHEHRCCSHPRPNAHRRHQHLQSKGHIDQPGNTPSRTVLFLTLPCRRCSAFSPVATCLAPVQRGKGPAHVSHPAGRTRINLDSSKGCPSAIAPPCTFTLLMSRPSWSTQYTACEAKASLICHHVKA